MDYGSDMVKSTDRYRTITDDMRDDRRKMEPKNKSTD